MYTLITSTIALLFLFTACERDKAPQSSAEVSDAGIPPVVQRLWDEEFPGTEITTFGVAASPGDTLYIVRNKTDEDAKVLRIQSGGEIVKRVHAVRIPFEDLPEAARVYAKDEYPGKKMGEVYRVDKDGELGYLATVIIKDDGTWVEAHLLIFDEDGSYEDQWTHSFNNNAVPPQEWDFDKY